MMTTFTSALAACRRRATTKPSPPLLPTPQTMIKLFPATPDLAPKHGASRLTGVLHEQVFGNAETLDGLAVQRPHF